MLGPIKMPLVVTARWYGWAWFMMNRPDYTRIVGESLPILNDCRIWDIEIALFV